MLNRKRHCQEALMARLRHRHSAFALIELLVVLAIMAILIGLLLSAIQKVREAADRVQSSNNLHQMALAIQRCQDQYDVLPPSFGYFPGGPGNPTAGGGTCGYGNLFFHLLPFVEQGNLYHSTGGPGDGPVTRRGTLYSAFGPLYPGIATHPLKIYQNPSDPSMSAAGTIQGSETTVDGWGACGYAFNAQVFCQVDSQGGFEGWWAAPRIPLTFADGTSQTILFTEKYAVCGQPGGPYAGANAWAEGPIEDATPVFSVSRFPTAGDPPGAIPSTGPLTHFQIQPFPYASDRCQYWVPQSARAGGILVGLADGSVRNVAAGIRSSTWWAACTPAGGEVLGADW
jgi:prepilin-type N-terminal cleavage/methylation domain-containing protein